MGLANILASALTVQGLFCAFVPTGLAGRHAPILQGTHPSEAEVSIVQNAPAILPWRTVVDARLRSRRFPDARNPEATLQYSAGGSASAGNNKNGQPEQGRGGLHHQCLKEGAAAQRSHAAKRAS
ncbi:MAG TPA: hypothetical protein DIW62_08350 [Raoultella sp.]|nr:hypothetical protein [Raoultella sp.]